MNFEKIAAMRSPFPDPQNIAARREAESHWQAERTIAVYTGLGRVVKCVGSGEQFASDDRGYVHVPVSQQGDFYLLPDATLEKSLESEPAPTEPLPPPRQSGRTWAEFLTR